MSRPHAILILGPTGSGKTPLGNELQRVGLNGCPCRHLDFGEQLRKITDGRENFGLAPDEITFVKDMVKRGALLENETFYIAERILQDFILTADLPEDGFIILNGLPRHIGQAMGVDRILKIVSVVHLSCTSEVVRQRIQTNAENDRDERTDDDLGLVSTKLQTFEERTHPLIDHYKQYGSSIAEIIVHSDSRPGDMIQDIYNAFFPEQ